jgi:hypothetical protein
MMPMSLGLGYKSNEDSMNSTRHPRMDRERRTVEAMLDLYCHHQHGSNNGLCAECEALRIYAGRRLEVCPFQEGKTTCAKCPVHCYQVAMRERIRTVMRYAGPRMLYRHPIMTLQHMVDGLRNEPVRSGKTGPGRSKVLEEAKE